VDCFAGGRAPLLLDVAHNPAGAWTLRAALAQLPETMPRTLIFSCLADKQIDEMAQVLLPLFDSTSGDPARARDHVILAPIRIRAPQAWRSCWRRRRSWTCLRTAASRSAGCAAAGAGVTPKEGVIVATGSVFLVGEMRDLALALT
jgi:dihydrofolate synthase/folylpolyglutamate synthase